MGRPNKYRKEFCDLLISHMEKGLSFYSFGAVADVTEHTLFDWVERYPDFGEAKRKGELKSLKSWETIGINGMLGKIKGWNPVSWIFVGKCRFRKYGYRDHAPEEEKPKEANKAEAAKALEELKTMLRDTSCQPTKPSMQASSLPVSPSGLLGESSSPVSNLL